MGEAWSLGHGALSQSLRNQLSDGASTQIKIAASNASASAMKKHFKELATADRRKLRETDSSKS
jgi:hypothetical protein